MGTADLVCDHDPLAFPKHTETSTWLLDESRGPNVDLGMTETAGTTHVIATLRYTYICLAYMYI